MKKIIYVCTGNTCRSPMAEAITNHLGKDKIQAVSRGLQVFFKEGANPKTLEVLARNNMPLNNHQALGFTSQEVDENTIVLTMTEMHKIHIMDTYPSINQVYTIKEFVGEFGDIQDPFGKDYTHYEACYKDLNRIIQRIINKLSDL